MKTVQLYLMYRLQLNFLSFLPIYVVLFSVLNTGKLYIFISECCRDIFYYCFTMYSQNNLSVS